MSQREICRAPNYEREHHRTWEAHVKSAAEAWDEIERASIGVLRTSGLIWVELDDLPAAVQASRGAGLHCLPMIRERDRYRCAVGTDDPAAWYEAWRGEDHLALGELMGYPECCVKAFVRDWVRERRTDWISTMPGAGDGSWMLNPFPYRLGARLTPWVPCSARCEASLERASMFLDLGRKIDADTDAIEKLLHLPYRWDARNGAAIVQAPGAFRFIHDTDVETRQVISREGVVDPSRPGYLDNGFRTHAAQRDRHEWLRAVVGETPGPIVDLGAGNGDLLAQFGEDQQHIGVEMDMERWHAGVTRRMAGRIIMIHDRIENTDEWVRFDPGTVLLAPQRLLEIGDRGDQLRMALQIPQRIVAYSWDSGKAEDMARLIQKTGLRQASRILTLEDKAAAVEVTA